MKIVLPPELYGSAQHALATLNPGLPQIELSRLPANHLAEPADALGRVLDFYTTAIERCYADATAEFYRDWPAAMEAARKTPACQYVQTLRIMVYKKSSERATSGNLQFFHELFSKCLQGQINLTDPLSPATTDQNAP